MKKILLSTYIACTLALVAGCKKDYLETSPTNQVSEEEIFNSIENANTALNGIYRFMFERTTVIDWNVQNKPGMGGILLAMDFMGDDLHISSANWFTSTGEGNWQGHRADNHALIEYYYRTLYKIVGDANSILDNIEGITGADEEKNSIKAQALVLRAYAYSYLVQFYGERYDASIGTNSQLGVPLVLTAADQIMPRATVEEVYESIVNDLEEAIALDIPTRTNKSLINKDVALGIRARVALTMQDYENAISYAKELIDNGGYSLMNQEDYMRGFNDATVLSEFIWASMPTQDQGDAFGSYFAQIAYDANTSYMRANPKRINSALYDEIANTDIRKQIWEPEPDEINFPLPLPSFARQPYMSRKFAIKMPGGSLGDVPLLRLSEVYLILAEAYASSNQDALAQQTLFDFVKERDLEASKSTNTGNALLEEIWVHRRVELWGEGYRFLDLKRLNQPLNRTAAPNFVSVAVGGLMEVPAGDDRWQFLFPRRELDANPEIVQND